MLDRIRPGPQSPAAAAEKMSRRKQACPSRSIKVLNEPSAAREEGVDADLSVVQTPGSSPDDDSGRQSCDPSHLGISPPPAEELKDEEDHRFSPLLINTKPPSSLSPNPSSLDCTPPLQQNGDPATTQPQPSLSPALDIPPERSEIGPLSLTLLPSSPVSPDHPSTPSSLNSSCSQAEPAANKQRRGKKIMPVAGNDGRAHWQCPLCKEQLGSDHEFTVHIRSHNNSAQAKAPNTCIICKKVLSSASSLDRHMLVHSGERPFKCKVCHMSFTTNGNMHRHSRIHNKEELKAAQQASEGGKSARASGRAASMVPLAPKPPSVSPIPVLSPNTSTSSSSWHRPGVFNSDRGLHLLPKPMSGVELKNLIASENMQQTAPLSTPAREPYMMNYLSEVLKRKQPVPDGDAPASKRHRIEKMELPHKVPGQDSPVASNANQNGGSDLIKSVLENSQNSLEKRNMLLGDSSGLDLHNHTSAQDEHHHSHKTLLGDYNHDLLRHQKIASVSKEVSNGLRAADRNSIQSGEATSYPCEVCAEQFDSYSKLTAHTLLTHCTSQQAEQFVHETLEGNKFEAKNFNFTEFATSGFGDLNFMDFTSKKFSLAAKAHCEQVPRQSNSHFHNYSCKVCNTGFPTKSSLLLHLVSHDPHSWSKCPLCDCHFVSVNQLQIHMQKHLTDEAFKQSVENADKEQAGKPETMEKKNFLAMFGLIATNDVKRSEKNEEIIESINKEQNIQYFREVNKVFGKKTSKENESSSFSVSKAHLSGIVSESSYSPSTHTGEKPCVVPSKDILTSPMSTPSKLFSPASAMTGTAAPFSPLDLSPSGNEGLGEHLGGPSHSVLAGDSDAATDRSKGPPLSCKFCGFRFLKKTVLKAHERAHLGLSHYKCTACSYSSADKSTLIRHMRTHNGHRPFKCNLCKYPFTTKANCERHIRKCHDITDKKQLDSLVSVQKYMTDLSGSMESFQSPDTVCQYCGVDFKFFRNLKKHLKTHNRCRQKPFTCSKCLVGFSMKARVIRHIQKQHPDVPQNHIEENILTNELAPQADDDNCFRDLDEDSDNTGAGYNTGSPSPSSTPGIYGEDYTPPKAHSTPAASNSSFSPASNSPLDFSLRNSEMETSLLSLMSRSAAHDLTTADADEGPIDLTTKGKISSFSSQASVSPFLAVTPSSNQASTPKKDDAPVLPCQLCDKKFATPQEAVQHLVTAHALSPTNNLGLSSTSDSNNNNTSSGASLPPFMAMSLIANLPYSSALNPLLQARASGTVPVIPTHPAFAHTQQQLASYLAAHAALSPSLLTGSLAVANIKKEPGTTSGTNSSGSESGCDLASVNKIIESTATPNIEIFLKPQVTNSGSDDSEPQSTPGESADEDSDQSLDQLYKQSINGQILPKISEDMKATGFDEHSDLNDDEIVDSATEEGQESSGEKSMSSQKGRAAVLNNRQGAGSKAASDKEGGTPQAKKKRNSYSDSPHRLPCPHCTRRFPWVSSLKRHLLTHTGQKPFKCPRCSVTFSTKSNRERHLIRKHGVNMLDPASRQTMDRPYKCHLCVFSSFSTESNLLKHYRERHPENEPPERYQVKMEREGEGLNQNRMDEEFDGLDASNMDDCSEDAEDMESNALIPDQGAMSTEMEDMDILKTAEVQAKNVQNSANLTTATDGTTNNNTTISVNLYDNDDDSSDNSPSQGSNVALLSPSLSGLAERHINPERDNYNVDKITNCWKCGQQFNSRKLLIRHLKEHNIDLPFKCYLCDASYDSRNECLMHQERSHSSDWAVLKEKNGVESIDNFSERLDRIVDRNCKTGQFGKDAEDGSEDSSMAIGEDGQVEIVASDYLQRKVYCSLCTKRFWSLQDLRRHMRSHTGERPFECDICHKRFTLKHSMMRHRRKHSVGNTASPTILSDDEDDVQSVDATGQVPANNMGSGHKALRQHLAAAVPRPASNIPTAVTEGGNGPQATESDPAKTYNDDDSAGEDILHNLLGVESSTIDKLMESKDSSSAASILGV